MHKTEVLGISDLPFPSVDMSSTDHLAHNRQGFAEDKIMAQLTPLESEPPRSCSTWCHGFPENRANIRHANERFQL